MTIARDLDVEGSMTVKNELTVTKDLIVHHDVTIEGDLEVHDVVSVDGDVIVHSDYREVLEKLTERVEVLERIVEECGCERKG